MQDRIYVTGGHYGHRGSCTFEKIQTYRADINEWSITTISPHPGKAKLLDFYTDSYILEPNFELLKGLAIIVY